MQYTIRQATPTGKNDPTYGAEYIVHFNEDQREVKMSRKNPPQVGGAENGTIIDGKYGAYFKKDPFVPNQTVTGVDTPPTQTAPAKSTYVPYKRTDNSDGMRQGMCINNASYYVAHIEDKPSIVNPKEWAQKVHAYANALYALGDLGQDQDVEALTVAGLYDN